MRVRSASVGGGVGGVGHALLLAGEERLSTRSACGGGNTLMRSHRLVADIDFAVVCAILLTLGQTLTVSVLVGDACEGGFVTRVSSGALFNGEHTVALPASAFSRDLLALRSRLSAGQCSVDAAPATALMGDALLAVWGGVAATLLLGRTVCHNSRSGNQ